VARILYPDDPLDQRRPEGLFLPEYEVARARGCDTSIFSFEDFERGRFNPKPQLVPGETVLYRGWMLNLGGYTRLAQALSEMSVQMVVSPDGYRAAHHLPAWYPLIKELTAETLILAEDSDFLLALDGTDWPGYFVKDFVKSLNTGAGSLVTTPADVSRVVSQLREYRGEIEGGVCVRRREDFVPGSERRYFVARSEAYSCSGDVPSVVTSCAARIPSPFFSVDVARRADGVLRIIEVGDGQVSDRKEWSAAKLVEVCERVG